LVLSSAANDKDAVRDLPPNDFIGMLWVFVLAPICTNFFFLNYGKLLVELAESRFNDSNFNADLLCTNFIAIMDAFV